MEAEAKKMGDKQTMGGAGAKPMFKQQDIELIPYKQRRDRKHMPFKSGQGVSLAGWQFEVWKVLPNGNLVLKPRGRIIEPPGGRG